MFEKNDIVQITDASHPWFPALLIVDEVKSWGVQAFALVPQSNDGSQKCSQAFNRLNNNQVEKVGQATIVNDEENHEN
jgi:hypothetical protein